MPKFLQKLDAIMERIEKNIVGYATIIMALLVFMNVVLRNTAKFSFPWVNEVASYLNILAVFIAVSAGFKYGSHVGVEAVVGLFKGKTRIILDIIAKALCLVFCAFIAFEGVRMVLAQMASGQVSAVLKIPIWIIYFFIVVGMIMSVIRLIMEMIKTSHGIKEDDEIEQLKKSLAEGAEK